MKFILATVAVAALMTSPAFAGEKIVGYTGRSFERQGECVNIVANYQNAAPTKCWYHDSNTTAIVVQTEDEDEVKAH